MRKHFAIVILIGILLPLILAGIAPSAAALADDNQSKISGLLALQVQAKLHALQGVPLQEGQIYIASVMQAEGSAVLPLGTQRIFIHSPQELSQSQIAELEAMGITLYPDSWIPPVKNHPTGFLLGDMPITSLAALASKDYITSLETAERVFEPQNDLAAQEIKADDVWDLGYDGTGVRIAVLDSGLDVTHNDIPTPVASKDYSNYPTLDDTVANIPGITGHGTHVTGSALGRGTQSSGVYKGSAPGADLVFLKIGNDTSGSASTDAIVYAMQAAVDTYHADVITMSYGGWDTYHDGSSEEAQAVDYAVTQGAVVLISAGNEASDDEHYSGSVAAGPNSFSDWIEVTVSSPYYLYYNLVWFDGTTTSNDLELHYYQSNQSTQLTPITASTQSESDRGTESEISRRGTSTVLQAVSAGTYYLRVENKSSQAQQFHIYNMLSSGLVTFASPDQNYTLGSPSDADSAIAVGAYTTRKYWWTYANAGPYSWTSGETVDQISTFSSRGPRVDTGAPSKPNVVAPGSTIISARDEDVYPWTSPSALYIDNDGPNEYSALKNDGNGPADYYVMQGTSMACPIAAGVAALILDKNPTWTPAQVRHAFESTATEKGTAGVDSTYGWGLVDAYAAINASLPVTASYNDTSHTAPDDDFAGAENTAYMNVTGLLPSRSYEVTYYDGSDTLRLTDTNIDSDPSGELSSQHTFVPETDVAGTWHVIVSEQSFSPPGSYYATWSYTITSDSFTVQQSAIPEFPTVLAALLALVLPAGIYLWMRRKAAFAPT